MLMTIVNYHVTFAIAKRHSVQEQSAILDFQYTNPMGDFWHILSHDASICLNACEHRARGHIF